MANPAMPLETEMLEVTTEAAVEEKAKLRSHFGRFDIFFFLICTIVGLDTLGAVVELRRPGVHLADLPRRLLLPSLCPAHRRAGLRLPRGGRPLHLDQARLRRGWSAAVNAVLYWLSNPIWLGGALGITRSTAFNEFFLATLGRVGSYVFALAASSGSPPGPPSCRSGSASGSRRSAPGSDLLLGVLHHLRSSSTRSRTASRAFGGGDFKPTYAVFIAAVPVLFFNYVGFELPSAAGDEMKDPQKDVPFTVIARRCSWRSCCYGVPILAILLVLPADQITEPRRVRRRHQDRLHRLRRRRRRGDGTVRDPDGRRRGAGRPGRDRLHLGAAVQRHDLDHGRRPGAGGGRATTAAARASSGLLRQFGTPVAVNLLSGWSRRVFIVAAFTFTGATR